MTTPTTPSLARNIARAMFTTDPAADALLSLAQQVEALTAELELARIATYCASISPIAKERDAFKADAELYRHLRDHFAKNSADAKAEFARLEPLTGAQFDAVVRASIAAMGAAT